jgi:nitrate/nitrite transporter NarK
MIAALQSLLLNTAQTLKNNPMALMRTVLFLLMFALAFGRQEVRERVRRLLRKMWAKVQGTVGMGVKVSYI